MNIRAIFRRMWAGGVKQGKASSPRPSTTLRQVLAQLAHTQEQELSCDEAYPLLDVMADAIDRGADTAPLLPLVQRHLDMCPDCQEEFTVLLRGLAATRR